MLVKSSNGAAPHQNLRSQVREDIRRLILSGEFKPGARLTQQQLAKRFGVSQTVVRESLLELHFTGLVHSVDNMGIFVGDLDPSKVVESYELREVFEGLAARVACERAGRADVRELYEMVERIYHLGRDKNETARGTADRLFHSRIIKIAGRDILLRLTDAYRMLGMIVAANRDHEVIHTEHLEIVKAIDENRPSDAERAAREHVAGARLQIEKQIRDGTFIPQWVLH